LILSLEFDCAVKNVPADPENAAITVSAETGVIWNTISMANDLWVFAIVNGVGMLSELVAVLGTRIASPDVLVRGSTVLHPVNVGVTELT
jgi:hypothetical protein